MIISKKHPTTSAMKMKTRSILLILGMIQDQIQAASKHYLVESKGKQYLVETEGWTQGGKGDVTFLGLDGSFKTFNESPLAQCRRCPSPVSTQVLGDPYDDILTIIISKTKNSRTWSRAWPSLRAGRQRGRLSQCSKSPPAWWPPPCRLSPPGTSP